MIAGDVNAFEQMRLSGALRDAVAACEYLGGMVVELEAAGRGGWATEAAKLHDAVDDLTDRIRENRR